MKLIAVFVLAVSLFAGSIAGVLGEESVKLSMINQSHSTMKELSKPAVSFKKQKVADYTCGNGGLCGDSQVCCYDRGGNGYCCNRSCGEPGFCD
jgi:hypothetical protein